MTLTKALGAIERSSLTNAQSERSEGESAGERFEAGVILSGKQTRITNDKFIYYLIVIYSMTKLNLDPWLRVQNLKLSESGAIAIWPAGNDDFNLRYELSHLTNVKNPQIYCDPGWASENIYIFSDAHPYNKWVIPSKTIITSSSVFSHNLPQLSGAPIEKHGIKDDDFVYVVKNGESYELIKANSLEEIAHQFRYNENVVAAGYASACGDEFPVIELENGRDSAMTFFHDMAYREKINKITGAFMHDTCNSRKITLNYDGKLISLYELESKISDEYLNIIRKSSGKVPLDTIIDIETRNITVESIEELSKREDSLGEMARIYLPHKIQIDSVRTAAEERVEQDTTALFKENFKKKILEPSSKLRDIAVERGKIYCGYHDLHDFDQSGFARECAPSENNLWPLIEELSKKYFEHPYIGAIPWVDDEGSRHALFLSDEKLVIDIG